METVEPSSDYDTSEAESDGEAPPSCNAPQHQGGLDENQDTLNVPRPPPTGGTAKEGDSTPSMAPFAAAPAEALGLETAGQPDRGVSTPQVQRVRSGADTSKALTSMTARKRRKRTGAPMQEGTYIGGGRRMMCYCPKHSHLAQASAQASATATHRQQGGLAAGLTAASGVPSVPVHPASNRTPTLIHQAASQQQQQQQQCPQQTSSATDEATNGSDDGQPAGHQLPHHMAGCIRGVPFNHACRRGQREPDAVAAALAKRLFVAKTPYTFSGPQRHARHQLPLAHLHANEAPFLVGGASLGHTSMGSGRPPSTAKTQTQRFKEMQQTVGHRLTCGKSAIHGLGAFTKQPHLAGDCLPTPCTVYWHVLGHCNYTCVILIVCQPQRLNGGLLLTQQWLCPADADQPQVLAVLQRV